MAQGKMKVKSASIQKKAKHVKKPLGAKKGGHRKIAPKKTHKVKEQRLKMHLQKSINASIESELVAKAGSSSLTVVKAPVEEGDGTKNKKECEKKS